MKKQNLILGLSVYFVVLLVLYRMEIQRLIQPVPMLSVGIGVIVLSISQWKKEMNFGMLLEKAKHNALFSGVFTSLLAFLSGFDQGTEALAQSFLPMVYGALVYVVIQLFTQDIQSQAIPSDTLPMHWNSPAFIQPILVQQGLTPRECHVALKVIQGASNKEIAEQLFISEGTVKKHIQNIYKRCEVEDRQAFLIQFWEWAKHT